MTRVMRALALVASFCAVPATAQRIDERPRTAVMTAFPPEWMALEGAVTDRVEHHVNGLTLLTGTLEGKPVVLIQSGVSMVNAAMNTQLVLDRFRVTRIVFSGIAGGVDPALAIGDVVAPAKWAQYMEVSLARETPSGWVTPEVRDAGALANFGMAFPRDVRVGNARELPTKHRWFMADPALLALAGKLKTNLARCAAPALPCLAHAPKVVVGGEGVSGPAFADNAAYREYLFATFQADVLDMESAAVAQVAYANQTPFIAFRSLSDLAGGDAGANQMTVFMALAARNSASVVRGFVAALPD
jgi:adenosylhomocysteine nucleosidase